MTDTVFVTGGSEFLGINLIRNLLAKVESGDIRFPGTPYLIPFCFRPWALFSHRHSHYYPLLRYFDCLSQSLRFPAANHI